MDNYKPTASARILQWIYKNPDAAAIIAYAAIEGLYISEEDGTTILPEEESYPRGAGSDYVDHVGDALTASGISSLISDLQREVENQD